MVNRKIVIAFLLLLSFAIITYSFIFGQTEDKSFLTQRRGVVVAKTDKIKYAKGQEVKITLENRMEESIYSIAASSTPVFAIENIEKQQSNGTWEVFSVRCRWPECDIDFDGPAEIRSNSLVKFTWKPEIHIKGKDKPVERGLYRIALTYQIRKDDNPKSWEWLTIKTNDFIVE